LHFHPEYEILYVIDGSGMSFVADSIEKFNSGDLVFLGSNLPHYWKSDSLYHLKDALKKVNYVVIQFPNSFLKETFSEYPEFHLISELFEKSSRGIRFEQQFAKIAGKKIFEILNAKGFQRVMILMNLLQLMAETNSYKLLAGEFYHKTDHDFLDDRLTKVMHYINTNYQQKIGLNKIASIANMHPASFCRYFKSKTGKSFSEFTTDLRIGYACKLLIEGNLSVSQVCFECGFNNLSLFNRMFKRQTNFSPSSYKIHFHNKGSFE
jgi:AraC-like DNA-binding protein